VFLQTFAAYRSLSTYIQNENTKALEVNMKSVFLNILVDLKNRFNGFVLETSEYYTPGDLVPQDYLPFPTELGGSKSNTIKTTSDLDLRMPRRTYTVGYDYDPVKNMKLIENENGVQILQPQPDSSDKLSDLVGRMDIVFDILKIDSNVDASQSTEDDDGEMISDDELLESGLIRPVSRPNKRKSEAGDETYKPGDTLPEHQEDEDAMNRGTAGNVKAVQSVKGDPWTAIGSSEWLYNQNQFSTLKRQFIFYVAHLIRSMLKQQSLLRDALMEDGNNCSRSPLIIESSEGMVGECIRAMFVKLEYPNFRANITYGPRSMLTYAAMIGNCVYNLATIRLMKDLWVDNFVPTIFTCKLLKTFEMGEMTQLSVIKNMPFVKRERWMEKDIAFIETVFLTPIKTLTDDVCAAIEKQLSASKRNHMKRDIRARFYKMVNGQWLRFIRFFGLRIGRYNAISALLQDDLQNHLHSGSPDNISKLDFAVTLLAAHIADNTVV
jgi:hypothetical protein